MRPENEAFEKLAALRMIYPDFSETAKKDLQNMPKMIANSIYGMADFIKYENSEMLRRARSFDFGLGAEKNPYIVFEAYQLSSKYSDVFAHNPISLSRLYRCAKDGNADAEYFMGVFFFDPFTSEMDNERAFYWFGRAAKKNHSRAIWALAHCRDRGIGTHKDRIVAFMLMRKAEAVLMLEENRPVKKIFSGGFASKNAKQSWRGMLDYDSPRASRAFYDNLNFYLDAANAGDVYVASYLACIYQEGIYLKRDAKKAFELWRKASEGGHKSAPYALGLCYLLGDGVCKDGKKAFENFALADANGYPTLELARCHLEGIGTEKDAKKALEVLKRVFNGDEKLAEKALSGLSENGVLKNLSVPRFDGVSCGYYRHED